MWKEEETVKAYDNASTPDPGRLTRESQIKIGVFHAARGKVKVP